SLSSKSVLQSQFLFLVFQSHHQSTLSVNPNTSICHPISTVHVAELAKTPLIATKKPTVLPTHHHLPPLSGFRRAGINIGKDRYLETNPEIFEDWIENPFWRNANL
ncbi:Hypothetical predicted protein, partial [Olea europaea subsp. europaea]